WRLCLGQHAGDRVLDADRGAFAERVGPWSRDRNLLLEALEELGLLALEPVDLSLREVEVLRHIYCLRDHLRNVAVSPRHQFLDWIIGTTRTSSKRSSCARMIGRIRFVRYSASPYSGKGLVYPLGT